MIDVVQHPNSKRVTVFQNPSFLAGAQDGSAQAYMATGSVFVGSYWENPSTPSPGTGLTLDEQRILLPNFLMIDYKDRMFREKVKEYYDAMNTKVDYKHGISLEVGLEVDNAKPIGWVHPETGKENLPIRIGDYLRYRQILGHPRVAPNKDLAEGNQLKEFYIFDPEYASISGAAKQDKRDEALQLYLTLAKNDEKLQEMLLIFDEDPREFSASERKEKVKQLADSRPEDFISRAADSHYEQKVIIRRMIATGVWTEYGSKIIDTKEKNTIGNNREETIAWILDKENANMLQIYKSKAQEALKVQRKRKTAAK